MSKNDNWTFPLFADHVTYDRLMPQLSDVHLYTGSKCNRSCDFCIVYGRPEGWYRPMTSESLDMILEVVPMDATIKFYGGEPTIDFENVIWAMSYLRKKGFAGWFTIFSNGVLAERVIKILESDEDTDVVLNYSILHGVDAEPIPPAALEKLKDYEKVNPGRIYSSHAGVFPYGRGAEFTAAVGEEHIVERTHTSYNKAIEIGKMTKETAKQIEEEKGFRVCPRCRPALRTDGVFHACPFAVESNARHYQLGKLGETTGEEVLDNFQKFLDWIDSTLEPEAERLKQHPCQICTHRIETLPSFRETRSTK
ncbi:MAG: radical SAM protein [Blastocatellia bacterium]